MKPYILQGKTAVLCPNMEAWGTWFSNADRAVKKTDVGGYHVSTVFLGLDHRFDDGPPLLFETMVFCDGEEFLQARCSTWDQAELQHQEVVGQIEARQGKILRLESGHNVNEKI